MTKNMKISLLFFLSLQVAENYVFYPPIVAAKALIDNGSIGQVRNIRIKYLGGSEGGWTVPDSAWQWRIEEAAKGNQCSDVPSVEGKLQFS
jgi:predicted dehydrogenase